MLSSAETPRDTVARTIVAIERSCLDAETALAERRWNDVASAFTAQSKLSGYLALLFDASPEHGPANDAKVAQRVRGILAYRADQLRRLEAFRDDVGTRLSTIGKMRAFSRSFGTNRRAPAFLNTQR